MSDLAAALAAAIASADPSIEGRIDSDPQANLDLVAITAQASAEATVLLNSAVGSARSAGWSWEAIGKVLGMTRQAAQQRFGFDPGATEDDPNRRRIVGLKAYNEIEVLNEMGREGWHSVGFGPLFHDVERTDDSWEHRRVFVGARKPRTSNTDGWERVGMWFPWVYYKRCMRRQRVTRPVKKPKKGTA